MTGKTIGGYLDMNGLAALAADPAQQHRPTDPAVLAREAASLIALGLSIPDAAQALDMTPSALARLLGPTFK